VTTASRLPFFKKSEGTGQRQGVKGGRVHTGNPGDDIEGRAQCALDPLQAGTTDTKKRGAQGARCLGAGGRRHRLVRIGLFTNGFSNCPEREKKT